MTYKEYSEKRDELLNKANTMIENGEDAAEIVAQVTALDDQYRTQVENQQNIEALRGQGVKIDVQNTTAAPVVDEIPGITVPMNGVAPAIEKLTAENAWESQVYADAFAKTLQGRKLTEAENAAYELVNDAQEYTHMTTEEGLQLVIPKTITDTIWREIEDLHPFIADIRKSFVKGVLTVLKEGTSTKAKWYEEDTPTEDGKDTVAFVNFGACELARSITLSWKLKTMATSQFLAYLSDRMAEAMADALAYGVLHGAGKSDDDANEPEGIVEFMPETQVAEYNDEIPTYQELAKARSLIKSGYKPVLYANSNMIWNGLTCIMDANGRPIFVPDPTSGGAGRIFGCVVKEEAGMDDGEFLFSEAGRAYQMNINQQITMTTEDHAKKRMTDYCGYAIVDGRIVCDKASSLLRKKG